MRLWTIHPRYLDPAGLVAAWREGQLARAVLSGKTIGYRHHPQLARFRGSDAPLRKLNLYLWVLYEDAERRGYRFDKRKIGPRPPRARLTATLGQLRYEWRHLAAKLKRRSPAWLRSLGRVRRPEANPVFRIVPGSVEAWEVGRKRSRTPRRRG